MFLTSKGFKTTARKHAARERTAQASKAIVFLEGTPSNTAKMPDI